MKRSCFLTLLLLSVVSCKGQNETALSKSKIHKPVTILDGNPKVVRPEGADPYTGIRCSYEDKHGNLWFGTTGAGVYRYDGKSFVNFTKADGLADDIVYCMLEDNAGILWFGTRNGVCRYDGAAFSYFPMPGMDDAGYNSLNGITAVKSPAIEPSRNRSVYCMIRDRSGNLWFGTEDMGLYRYDGSSFTHFKYSYTGTGITPKDSVRYNDGTWRLVSADSAGYDDGRQLNAVQCMMEDKTGNIWFGAIAHGGVYRYDGKTFVHFADNKGFRNTHVFAMMQDRMGNLWFSTRDNGLVRYDGSSFLNRTTEDGLCYNFVSSMIEDHKGNLWFGSSFREEAGRKEGCVTRYNGKAFTPFPLEGLGNTAIWSILEDKNGNVWLGARNVSLYRYDGASFTDFTEKDAAQ